MMALWSTFGTALFVAFVLKVEHRVQEDPILQMMEEMEKEQKEQEVAQSAPFLFLPYIFVENSAALIGHFKLAERSYYGNIYNTLHVGGICHRDRSNWGCNCCNSIFRSRVGDRRRMHWNFAILAGYPANKMAAQKKRVNRQAPCKNLPEGRKGLDKKFRPFCFQFGGLYFERRVQWETKSAEITMTR